MIPFHFSKQASKENFKRRDSQKKKKKKLWHFLPKIKQQQKLDPKIFKQKKKKRTWTQIKFMRG